MALIPFVPQPLIEDIAYGRCLPFIGAGFSKNADTIPTTSLPSWQELAAKLAAVMPDLPSSLTSAEVTQEYEKRFGRVDLLEAISEEIESCEPQPGAVHEAFARLPFEIVYTTNFDRLLERTYEKLHYSVIPIASNSAMAFVGGRKSVSIIKMHGDIDHRESMIVTASDFSSYLATHPVIATHLSSMFITKTFLFIGYSLSDPNVQSINSVIRERLGDFKRRSYWIGFDITETDVVQLGGERVNVVSISTSGMDALKSSKSDRLLSVLKHIEERVNILKTPLSGSLRAQSFGGRGLL